MNDAINLFGHYVSTGIRSQLQYRASFVLQLVGQLLITFIDYLGVWVLFDRFGRLPDWRLEEVALLYGMVHVAFSLAEAMLDGFHHFGPLVKEGEFDRILLRPRSTILQVVADRVALHRLTGS